eukprot:TRINITY_DN3934_c0_g1_i6.p1 TRINITY_DN3934_c0_g1~~TRINITY_DN3934_c0_g1_i6.p1  ORF type:complete len:519 (-),score=27.21 TRINITY_DN3934_c0_g1_i6:92-1603(-)
MNENEQHGMQGQPVQSKGQFHSKKWIVYFYIPAFLVFNCGEFGEISDKPGLVYPVYLLLIVPFTMYLMHDVFDERWREIDAVFKWQQRYMIFNLVISPILFVYGAIQICGEDHKETAATILVLVVGWVGAWKAIRGIIVERHFFQLQRNARQLVSVKDPDIMKMEVRGIHDMISARIMDDDYPGAGPRIRWLTGYYAEIFGFTRYHRLQDVKELALAVIGWISTIYKIDLLGLEKCHEGWGGQIRDTASMRLWNWMYCIYGYRIDILIHQMSISTVNEGDFAFQFSLVVNVIRRMLCIQDHPLGTDLYTITQDRLNFVDNELDDNENRLTQSLSNLLGITRKRMFVSAKKEPLEAYISKKEFMEVVINLCPVAATELLEGEASLPAKYSNNFYLVHIIYLLLKENIFIEDTQQERTPQLLRLFTKREESISKPLITEEEMIIQNCNHIRQSCGETVISRLVPIVGVLFSSGQNQRKALNFLYKESSDFALYTIKRVLMSKRKT